MTKREFLEKVIATVGVEELIDYAKLEIEKLDKKNDAKKNTLSKTQLENIELKKTILEKLDTENFSTASEIAEILEISTQKSSALLRQLSEENKVVVEEIKVPKKGKVKGYKLA